MIGTLQGPWLLCAAVLLLAVVMWRSPRPRIGELGLVGAIFSCAVAARLLFGIWGPLHVNGQGPLWIRGALDPAPLAGYGPGYFELCRWVTAFGSLSDRALFAANAVLSGLSPALLYATARLTGVGRGGAFAVAVALAADAVTIRTAASESYFASLIVLVLAVQAALALGVRAHVRGDGVATNLAFVAAGLVAATVARIHPMSYLPLALCPLVVLGAAQANGGRSRLMLTAMAAAVIGITVFLTSVTTIITALRASPMAGQAIAGLAPRDYPLVLVTIALLLLLHRWMKPPWLPLLGICSLVLLLATQNAFQQSQLWKLCYQRIFLAGILLGAAPLLPRRMQGLGWASAGAAVTAVVLLVPVRPYLGMQTTEQLEYRFLQEALRGMPPHCTVAGVSRAAMRLWEIPSYLAPQASGQRTVGNAADLDAAPGDCLLYVRSSLCSSIEARTLCESIEREARLERVASRLLPSMPSYTGLPYDRPEVEVVLFRVTGHKLGVNDGAAIPPAFAQLLYDRLKPLREADGCTIVRVDTSRFRMTVGLQARSGGEHSIELATAPQRGGWVLVISDDGRRECPAMVAAIEHALGEIGNPTQ